MQLVAKWSGLFQAAFKHQVIVQGAADAHYLRRPDILLPTPPVATIDVPAEAVPNLRDVVGVDADGTLRVLGPAAREEALPDGRRVLTIPGIAADDPDDDGLIDHELGSFFLGNVAAAPDGRILSVSNAPAFALHDPDGAKRVSHRELLAGTPAWETPTGDRPFWETGAGDVAADATGFLVGGDPLYRLDRYGWDGRLLASVRRFMLAGTEYDLAAERITNVALAPDGRLVAASAKRLFVFAPDGAPLAWHAGDGADFRLWVGCAADGTLWVQSYKGKEVAYTAYDLPG